MKGKKGQGMLLLARVAGQCIGGRQGLHESNRFETHQKLTLVSVEVGGCVPLAPCLPAEGGVRRFGIGSRHSVSIKRPSLCLDSTSTSQGARTQANNAGFNAAAKARANSQPCRERDRALFRSCARSVFAYGT